MQRSNETKAKAFRIEFFLLFLFFLIGGAGFFLSLTSLDDSEPTVNPMETFTLEKEPYLSRQEEIKSNEWITFDINDYLMLICFAIPLLTTFESCKMPCSVKTIGK